MIVSSATAQNTTRGAKATKNATVIQNYSFTKALNVSQDSDVMIKEEDILATEVAPSTTTIRRVTAAANIPGNYVAGKTAKPDYNPVLKQAAAANRVCQSQPINIHKTVVVQQ